MGFFVEESATNEDSARDLIIGAIAVEKFYDYMRDLGYFGDRPCMAYDEYMLVLQDAIDKARGE